MSQSKGGDSQKSTTTREALRQWEENTGEKAGEAIEVKLIGLQPPIEKLDASLQNLTACEKLSLSTNTIEKLNHLNNLRSLRILSLGRNNIKSFAGLEVLAETLEQLWISYNLIEKLKGIGALKKLKVLYMSNNLVKEWGEFMKLLEVSTLEELNFVGNPLEEKHSAEGTWRSEVERKLTALKKLDGLPIIRDVDDELIIEQQQQQQQQQEAQQPENEEEEEKQEGGEEEEEEEKKEGEEEGKTQEENTQPQEQEQEGEKKESG